jgi:hypothetical protein
MKSILEDLKEQISSVLDDDFSDHEVIISASDAADIIYFIETTLKKALGAEVSNG